MNIGERVGDYEVLESLGAGGMGQVFKVRNVFSERIEAMKVLHPALGGDPDLAVRFLREIKTLAVLDHPNIAKLVTATQLGERIVMVVEYVEGQPLDKLLASGALTPELSVNYTRQILNALTHAHGQGIVHRDIKPANIIVTRQGQVKLMDFGISFLKQDSRLTKTGGAVGSLHYMSPEQIRGAAVDERADIYSLGVTMYEMVTGRRPFLADSDYQLMTAQLMETPPAPIEIAPSIPADLSDIIVMAIAKDADARFQSAVAFRGALGSLQLSGAVAPPPIPVVASVPVPVPESLVAEAPVSESVVSSADHGISTRTLFPNTQESIPTPPPIAVPPTLPKVALPPTLPMQAAPANPAPRTAPPTLPKVSPTVAAESTLPYPGNKSRRGLYMAVGSLATIAVLAAAVIYGPRLFTSRADAPAPTALEDGAKEPTPTFAPAPEAPVTTATSTDQNAPAVSPEGAQQASAQQTATPAVSSSQAAPPQRNSATTARVTRITPTEIVAPSMVTSTRLPGARAASQSPVEIAQARPPVAVPEQQFVPAEPVPSAAPVPVNTKELNDLREKFNSISIRAAAMKDQMNVAAQRMAAQGLALRGDARTAEAQVQYQLNEAMQYMRKGDVEHARQALQYAEGSMAALAKALGQ